MPETQETQARSLDREDPREEEVAPHFSIVAWKIPWAEEPGRLQPTRPQRVGHDWETDHIEAESTVMLTRGWHWGKGEDSGQSHKASSYKMDKFQG